MGAFFLSLRSTSDELTLLLISGTASSRPFSDLGYCTICNVHDDYG